VIIFAKIPGTLKLNPMLEARKIVVDTTNMLTLEKPKAALDQSLQAKLLEIGVSCTSLNLKKAARAVSHIVDETVRHTGLRYGQFGMLVAVANRGTVTVSELADALIMDITTLSRNVRLLERDGFVTISSGRDRRVREIELTLLGAQKINEVLPHWEQAQEKIKLSLGSGNWELLMEQLHKVAQLEVR
jgi:DNA-binding MarR family transcriptional regulator